jgi:hypothetical protein
MILPIEIIRSDFIKHSLDACNTGIEESGEGIPNHDLPILESQK